MGTAHALGLPTAPAALGAFNPLLVDNGGPYRTRLTTMLTTMLGGAISYIAGALVPHGIGWVVLATLAVGFGVTFARVLNQQMASSSVLILVLYFAGLGGSVHTLEGAVSSSGIVLLGGVWSIGLSLVLWPLDAFRPARLAVAGCFAGMSEFTWRLAGTADEAVEDGFAWRRQQRIRIEEARATLAGTAARAPSRTIRFRNLTVLLETSDMLLARTMRLAEFEELARREGLPESLALARQIASWLAEVEHAIGMVLAEKPGDAAAAFSHEGSFWLDCVTRRRQRIAARRAVADDAVYGHLLREERDALLEVEILFDAVRGLWTGTEMPQSAYVSAYDLEAPPKWVEALEVNFTMKSAAFRHALRMMLVGTVDVLIMDRVNLNHGFWLPMTSIILLQPYSAGTVRKSIQRVTGTVAGGVLAAVLAAAIAEPWVMFAAVTMLGALTVGTFAVDYAVYCFFLTPTFVLLSLPHPHDWQYALIRIGTTLVGSAIAVVAMRFLWPERAEAELGHLMRRGAGAAAAYLQAMLDFWQFEGVARREGERRMLAPARRGCGLASNDAEEAVDRVLQEPSFGRLVGGRADAETALRTDALTYVTYLRRLTQTITTLALVGKDSEEARRRLEPIARRLRALAAGRGDEPVGALAEKVSVSYGVDVAEEQMQRMERQTTVLERAAEGIWHPHGLESENDTTLGRQLSIDSSLE